jgi:hypothetical protein
MNKVTVTRTTVATLCILLISASSAAAKFVSDNGTSSGAIQLKTGTSATFSIEDLGETEVSITCGEIEFGSSWIIRLNHVIATEGNQLGLGARFTKCTEKLGGVSNPATINKTCELDAEEGTTLTAGVNSECIITQAASGCVITFSPKLNSGLNKVTAANVLETIELTFSVKGFNVFINKRCEEHGVHAFTGVFSAVIIAHEGKFV